MEGGGGGGAEGQDRDGKQGGAEGESVLDLSNAEEGIGGAMDKAPAAESAGGGTEGSDDQLAAAAAL